MNSYALVFLAVLPFCLGSAVPSLPKVRLCKGEEPKLSECWKSNLKEVVHSLKNGVPQHNIPPLTPMYVPSFTLETETLSAVISNLQFDFSNYDIVEVLCHPNTNSATIKVLIKELKLKGDGKVKGNVKDLDVTGFGEGKVSYVNVTTTLDLEWENFEANGHRYHNIFGKYDNIDFGHMEFHKYEPVKDADKHAKLKQHYLDIKQTADYEKFLHKIENAFFKHLLRYILRAYNSFQVAEE